MGDFASRHEGGEAQGRRTGQAEVGEEQIVGDAVLVVGQGHVAQGDALKGLVGEVGEKGAFSGLQGRDGMFEVAGNVMAKTGRAGGRVGLAAGGHDQAVAGPFLVFASDMENLVFLDGDDVNLGGYICSELGDFFDQGVDDGAGLVGAGKDTAVVLDLEFDAVLLEEVHDVVVVKLREDAVEEAAVAGDAGHEVVQGPVISDIAAATASAS